MNTVERVNWLGTTDEDETTIIRFMQSYHWYRQEGNTREDARTGAREFMRQVSGDNSRTLAVIDRVVDDRMLP